MSELSIPSSLGERLHRESGAERWHVASARFTDALGASLAKAFADRRPTTDEIELFLASLHLADLALACACADGHDEAWDHFVREHRPILYRAAEAIAGAGEARELADSLYGELFGVFDTGVKRRSLLLYFHGRSSLATWLRAVLAQRHVDAVRRRKRLEPLADDDVRIAASTSDDPERSRWVAVMTEALGRAVGRLPDRDRLRLECYYAQELTLAQVGRTLGEHEASVSRHLARTRKVIRQDVERRLREEWGLTDVAIAQCFSSVVSDAGTIDLGELLGHVPERKESALERSQ